MVASYIQQDLWGNYVTAEKAKRKLHLFTLAEEQVANLETINLSTKNAYGIHANFLGNNIALLVREKNADNETTGNYIELISPLTGQRVKKIELSFPGYKDTNFDDVGIDSDGKNLFVLPLRTSSLQSKPPLLITKDGNVRKIALPVPNEDQQYTRNYFPKLYADAIEITNKLLAITVKVPPNSSYETIFWDRDAQLKLIDVISSRGNINGEEKKILISYNRFQRSLNEKSDYTLLTFSHNKQAFSQLDIEWSCALNSHNEGLLASTLGLVDGDNLIIGAYGTIATVPISNFTNSQTLYNPSCRSN